jgi:type I restriction-modification system DNA methylase subunit
MPDYSDIQSIRNFKSLVKYLRKHLDWPIDEEQADDLTFDYTPSELGLDEQAAVKIKDIKQIRPLAAGQPWGIFWIEFENKRLPVVVMRRILAALVKSKRGAKKAKRAAWDLRDLMFISATGAGHQRGISFAHFREQADGQPQLRVFAWDVQETHLYYIKNLYLEALHWPEDEHDIEAWRERWASAFTTGYRQTIETAKDLASRMAKLAAATREMVNQVYVYEKPNGPLHRLYDNFKRVLIHDLSVDDFADMYAQTVAYGLFSARVTRTGKFALENVVGMIPNTNPFLRELLEECLKVGAGNRKHQIDLDELGVGELVETLQDENTDMEAVLRDFGKQSHAHKEDPVVHFYESFLREYDRKKKARRGVFYTPDPVVSFIVRSVDYLLRTEFNCPDGLATPLRDPTGLRDPSGLMNVIILDPAVGTGTFEKYVIELVYETFRKKHKGLKPDELKKRWNEYVARDLLPRLYGFELMMAPYAVAHMKLGLALKETGYDFESDARLRVYLTNALQPAHEVPRVDTAFLAHEAEEANKVKANVPVAVVIGNPPYSVSSANAGDWIVNLLEDYKRTVRSEETQIQAISDDYVKFVRFAHWRIEETGRGIIGFVTNNGYLRGPLFRDMRKALINTFAQIYILNLHGSTRWKETTPDGREDKNVFDIQQGVAIILLVHREKPGRHIAKLMYADLWGTREEKYSGLMQNDAGSLKWQVIQPISPLFIFSPMQEIGADEYSSSRLVTEVFGTGSPIADPHVAYGAGFATQQDDFAISFLPEEVAEKIAVLCDEQLSEYDVRQRFRLCTTNQWNFAKARQSLRKGNWRKAIAQVTYRPFDNRYTAYVQDIVSIPRWAIMKPLLKARGDNLAFVTARIINGETPRHEFVSRLPIEKICLSAKTSNNAFVFPLYLYPADDESQPSLFIDSHSTSSKGRRPNLSPKFIADVESRLDLKFIADGTGDLKKTFGPEDVFHYMYAVFHSPTYRTRYAEFLKIDFPRLPLTRDIALFRTLAAKGKDLVALHLMESPALNKPITKFVGKGDNVVAKGYPTYEDKTVWINDTQGFAGVPPDVWEFHVGGYQVCHKWLKDRRERKLSQDDIAHYQKIVVALKETIRLMEEIDAAIPGWPME